MTIPEILAVVRDSVTILGFPAAIGVLIYYHKLRTQALRDQLDMARASSYSHAMEELQAQKLLYENKITDAEQKLMTLHEERVQDKGEIARLESELIGLHAADGATGAALGTLVASIQFPCHMYGRDGKPTGPVDGAQPAN